MIILHGPRREALNLNRRVNHGRVAREVAFDPLLRRLRVGDVGVDPLCGDEIPLAPAMHHLRENRPHDYVARLKRRFTFGPGVAERVVAVTDVNRVLVRDHAMRPSRRARYDEVVAAQIERLDRCRVERQQRAEVASRGAQFL